MRLIILVLAMLLIEAAPSSAAERAKLDGWGPFKFAMTHAQAKSAGGTAATLGPNGTIQYNTEIGGTLWDVSVWFTGAGGKVRDIVLVRADSPSKPTQDECFVLHVPLASMVSSTYGKPDSETDSPYPISKIQRRSTYLFKDKAEIHVSTTYDPAGKKCAQLVNYIAPTTVAKGQF